MPFKTFQDRWRELDRDVQDKVLHQVQQALLWRGWDRTPGQRHAQEAVVEIGKILLAAGCDVGEYT